MTTETQTLEQAGGAVAKPKSGTSTLSRVTKYTIVRLVMLFITVVIGVYLTILIANMGGYVDNIRRGDIREAVAMRFMADPALKNLQGDAREERMAGMIALEEQRLGLNQPFLVRSFRYLSNALTLNLGRSQNLSSDSGSRQVRNIILERLPPTLILFGTADLILFFLAIFMALALSRK
jgi:peptide/nickel transport system permease protein